MACFDHRMHNNSITISRPASEMGSIYGSPVSQPEPKRAERKTMKKNSIIAAGLAAAAGAMGDAALSMCEMGNAMRELFKSMPKPGTRDRTPGAARPAGSKLARRAHEGRIDIGHPR